MKSKFVLQCTACVIVASSVGGCIVTRTREEPVAQQIPAQPVAQPESSARDQLSKLVGDFSKQGRFDFDSADLKPEAQQSLTQIAQVLSKNPDQKIKIDAFTDSVGSEKYNQELSERRAQAATKVLEDNGVKPDQIQAAGHGESNPVASNDNDSGRSENRRVEVTLG